HRRRTAILSAAPAGAPLLGPLAVGDRRAAYLPVSPPDDISGQWTADPAHGGERAPAPTAAGSGSEARVGGELWFVPDAPDADLLVGVALRGGEPVGVAIETSADGVTIASTRRYDATRSLGHVSLDDADAL